MANKKINRIKVMLAEKGRTNKWLAEQVAKVLEVEIKDLIREQDE